MDALTRFGVAFIGMLLLVGVVITGKLVAEFVGLFLRSLSVTRRSGEGDCLSSVPTKTDKKRRP